MLCRRKAASDAFGWRVLKARGDRIDNEVASRHIVLANAEYRVECVLN